MSFTALQCAPFRARHIKLINPDADQRMLELGYWAQETGPAYTAFLFGQPIGAGGIAIYSGIAEVWTIFTPTLKLFPLWVTHQCLEKLNKFRDLDLYAQAEQCNEKFIKFMGFQEFSREAIELNVNEGCKLYVRRKWHS